MRGDCRLRSWWPQLIGWLEFDLVWSFDLAAASTPNTELHTFCSARFSLFLASHFERLVSLPYSKNGSHNCANSEDDGSYGLGWNTGFGSPGHCARAGGKGRERRHGMSWETPVGKSLEKEGILHWLEAMGRNGESLFMWDWTATSFLSELGMLRWY